MRRTLFLLLLFTFFVDINAQSLTDSGHICVPTISMFGACRVVAQNKYPMNQRFRYETGLLFGAEFKQNKCLIAFKSGVTFEDNLLNEYIDFHALYCNVPVIIELQFPVKTDRYKLSVGVGGFFEILAKPLGTSPVVCSPGGCYQLSDYNEAKACFEFLVSAGFHYQFHRNCSVVVTPYAKIPVKKYDYFITPVIGLSAALKFHLLSFK